MAKDKGCKCLFNTKVQFFALNRLPSGNYHITGPACTKSGINAIFRPHQYISVKSHNPKLSKRYGGYINPTIQNINQISSINYTMPILKTVSKIPTTILKKITEDMETDDILVETSESKILKSYSDSTEINTNNSVDDVKKISAVIKMEFRMV